MDNVVDLAIWREARRGPGGDDPGIRRLELAVSRLDAAATRRLDGGRALDPAVETELLAILGAIATDLVDEAASRADDLARRLTGSEGR